MLRKGRNAIKAMESSEERIEKGQRLLDLLQILLHDVFLESGTERNWNTLERGKLFLEHISCFSVAWWSYHNPQLFTSNALHERRESQGIMNTTPREYITVLEMNRSLNHIKRALNDPNYIDVSFFHCIANALFISNENDLKIHYEKNKDSISKSSSDYFDSMYHR